MKRALLAVGVVIAAAVPLGEAGADHAPPACQIVVKDNRFTPQQCEVALGGVIRWTAFETGHTITADTGEFDFHPGRTVSSGETVEWRAPEEDRWVFFHCRVHATPGDGTSPGRGSMVGRIMVGHPEPFPTPSPDPPPPVLHVPSGEYPTLNAAVTAAEPGSVVELARGTHRLAATAVVHHDDLTIRGEPGAGLDEIVLEPQKEGIPVGVNVLADRVRIENLTVRRFLRAGISVEDGDGVRLERVSTTGPGDYGVLMLRSRRTVLREVTASGKTWAGIAVRDCRDCDLLADGVMATGNFVGIDATNAGAVTILRSAVRDNATGIVLRTLATSDRVPQRGSHVWDSTIENNANPSAPRPSIFRTPQEPVTPTGAGIWIAGGAENVIEDNAIGGNRYGVLVTSFQGVPLSNRTARNRFAGDDQTDVGYDGTGAGNCFSSNDRDGGTPRSNPALVETLYGCNAPTTVGVPNPTVTADVALYAWRTTWCRDLGAPCA